MSATLEVLLFARVRDLVGRDCTRVLIPANTQVAELRAALGRQHPELAGLLPHCVLVVNQAYASDSDRIPADAEVALLPPVSGG